MVAFAFAARVWVGGGVSLGVGVGVLDVGGGVVGVTPALGGASPPPFSIPPVGTGADGVGVGDFDGVGVAGCFDGGADCGAGAPGASGMSSPPSLRSRNSLSAMFQFRSR